MAAEARGVAGSARNGERMQVVILAGGTGSRMHPLTEQRAKAMLQVANRPLLLHSLRMLARAGFREAFVVVNRSLAPAMGQYLAETYPLDAASAASHDPLNTTLLSVHDDIGTADALREISHHISSDFLVISSDLVTDGETEMLAPLIAQHMNTAATLTVLLAEPHCSPSHSSSKDSGAAGSGTNVGAQVAYIGLDTSRENARLVWFQSAADVDEQLKIPAATLARAPSLELHRELLDAHVYVLAHWTLSVLAKKPSLSSIKAEFIPFLVEHQLALGKLLELHNNYSGLSSNRSGSASLSVPSSSNSMSMSAPIPASSLAHPKPHLSSFSSSRHLVSSRGLDLISPLLVTNRAGENGSAEQTSPAGDGVVPAPASARSGQSAAPSARTVAALAHWGPPVGSGASGAPRATELMFGQLGNSKGGASPVDRVFCGAFVAPRESYLVRVNTLPLFVSANRDALGATRIPWLSQAVSAAVGTYGSGEAALAESGGAGSGGGAVRSHVSADSAVGVGLRLEEKSSVKRSVVGDHCVLGKGVKLSQCVIMDHVAVGDDCVLSSCVVCSNADIQQGCTLKDCTVGYSATVSAGTDAKAELITNDTDADDIFF